MKLDFSLKKIPEILKKKYNLLIIIGVILAFAWLLYFVYANVYTTAFAPEDIAENEIIAKQEKVNLELFNSINEKINEKGDIDLSQVQNLNNPFQ